MDKGFLNSLRRKQTFSRDDEKKAEKFFFQLGFDAENGPVVRTVSPEGDVIIPKGRIKDPAINSAMSFFRGRDTDNLGWAKTRSVVSLAEAPQLSYMLMQCDNVVNQQMEAVTYDPTPVHPLLCLTDDDKKIVPSLCVETENRELRPIAFLTDSLVLYGHTMSPCKPVGEYFRFTPELLSPFEAELVESYLSVVLSTLTNIGVRYGNRRFIDRKETSEKPLPGLIFEKVDFDKALFLRVLSIVPGLSPELSADFALNTIATVTSDNIILRHIQLADNESILRGFEELLDTAFTTQRDRKSIYRDGSLFVLPQAQASTFLMRMLPHLVREYTILGAEKLREFKIQASQPRLNVKVSSGINFLEGNVTVDLGEETMTLGQLLRQYRKNKYVELTNGQRVIVEDAYIKRLERIFRPSEDENPDSSAVKVSFFDIPGLQALLGGKDLPEFAHSRKFYNGLNALPRLPYDSTGLNGTLRPYQEEGAKWMEYLGNEGLGGCLADDMGLGKTIQTISVLTKVCARKDAGTVLIVMPRSLLFNWKSELERFAPQLTTSVYHGIGRDYGTAMKSQIVLTTYAMVRNDIKLFKDTEFEYVILDESQNIKNLAAQTTSAVLALNARHRLALSGTPMENNLQELYSLFRFLNPGMFGTPEEFNLRYAGPIQREGDKEAMTALRRKIFPFILRRLKGDVLEDLPERIDNTLYVEMEPDHRRLYERRRLYYKDLVENSIRTEGIGKSQTVMFQALSELRRIASVPESLSDGTIKSPKIELLVEQVTQSVANGHKVVVFFNFIAGLELAAEQLRDAGIECETMTGATSRREAIVKRFQTDPECSVLLMTIKVGGVGLNLTAADIVYIVEPWWNKAAEEQAINRLHRIGQKATVFAYSMITHDTIEEKIRQLQEQKAELFDSLISADSTMSKSLTEEDINFILS